jgi:hypothetical protein
MEGNGVWNFFKKGIVMSSSNQPSSQTTYHKNFSLSNPNMPGLYPIYPHLSSIKTYKKSPKISKYGRQIN